MALGKQAKIISDKQVRAVAPSDPRATFGSGPEWQQWVMEWTPPDGIFVPR
jgi:hypothetical protein